ncbi:hypothetical protein CDD82_3314 [Ophiocordyceps australis]|uniref:GRF-type domain-containing protein n=1 Tax=Ophiocordyceps australis TaxID=1399860 RepID=A0A2C5ZDK6_9HYPO|nr:hypothetical protein CDD82_3314 [Ophiocordyceps australis]
MAAAPRPQPLRRNRHASPTLEPGLELPTSPPKEKCLDERWRAGHWWCNCDPPKKAVLRQVKKNSANKGKLFWSCPALPAPCSFFLWRDDACLRETSHGPVVPDNPCPPPTPTTPALTQRRLTSYYRPAKPTAAPASKDDGQSRISTSRHSDSATDAASFVTLSTPIKRNRDAFEQSVGDFHDDFGPEDERQLAELVDRSVERAHAPTPANPITPSLSRNLFPPTQTSKRRKTVSFQHCPSVAVLDTPSTASWSHGSSSSTSHHCQVTQSIVDLLHSHKLHPAAIAKISSLLHDGKESASKIIKQRNGTIANLEKYIAVLETCNQKLESQVTGMKAQLMHMYSSN